MNTLPSLNAGFLFTPPENTVDSFSTVGPTSPKWHNKLPSLHRQGLSPPITPENGLLPSFDCPYPTTDDPLFPLRRESSEAPHEHLPLFSPDAQQPFSPSRASTKRRYSDTFDESPNRLGSIGRVVGTALPIEYSPAGAQAYYDARMVELNRYRGLLPKPTNSPAAERDSYSKRQLLSLNKPNIHVKVRQAARPKPIRPVVASPKVTVAHTKRTAKSATPKTSAEDAFSRDGQAPKHKRAAPSKKVDGKDEDRKWREIPDYCPPLDSLDSAAKPLKADWKAEPRDISREVDADMLSAIEYQLASGLRLLPQQYLANKRRMFQGRVQLLKEHKNFTKTAAQLVCNIDVNKASSLWEAFNRVGWFDEKWFSQHL